MKVEREQRYVAAVREGDHVQFLGGFVPGELAWCSWGAHDSYTMADRERKPWLEKARVEKGATWVALQGFFLPWEWCTAKQRQGQIESLTERSPEALFRAVAEWPTTGETPGVARDELLDEWIGLARKLRDRGS